MLWAEEGLPLAAALQMKRGAVLYRDIWFDKPPLVAAIYLLWGALDGVTLRIAGALYGLAACIFAYAATKRHSAAALTAAFLTFDTHSSVLPLAADLLLVVPHFAAIFFAWRRQAFWSGVAAGVGFLVNVKAVFVLAACALFLLNAADLALLATGFASPNVVAGALLAASGAWPAYLDQVWRWPAQYAGSPVVANPVHEGLVRTWNWLGFHAALMVGAICVLWFKPNWRYLAWLLLAFAGVALGLRFFPRYYFLLLPPLVLIASQTRSRVCIWIMAIALLLPIARFGPRYFSLDNWADLSLDRDSRNAAQHISTLMKPDATLYVWGYRPELFVYTKLKPASPYLECQAMTGVPADRHLTQSNVVLTRGTHEAREELASSHPDVIADGLSLFNPALSMDRYRELQPWLAQYREAARTNGTIIYVRR